MASFSEFAGNYLKGTDLQGREWPVTIERIVEEEVGDDEKPRLVAHFKDRRKTLPLNKGHIAVLSQAFGDNPDNCRGANIIIFPEATRTPQGPARHRSSHQAPASERRRHSASAGLCAPPQSPLPQSLATEMDDKFLFDHAPDGRGMARCGHPHEAVAPTAGDAFPRFQRGGRHHEKRRRG